MARTRLLGFLLRTFIAGAFYWAAAVKVLGVADANTVYASWVSVHPSLNIIVPCWEFLLASWLISGLRMKGCLAAIVVTLGGFSGLLVAELFKDHPAPCGCMGETAQLLGGTSVYTSLAISLIRNILMLAACAWLAARKKPGAVSHRQVPVQSLASSAMAP